MGRIAVILTCIFLVSNAYAQPWVETCAKQFKVFENGEVLELGTDHSLLYLVDILRSGGIWSYDPRVLYTGDVITSEFFTIGSTIFLVSSGPTGQGDKRTIQAFSRSGELLNQVRIPWKLSQHNMIKLDQDRILTNSRDSLYMLNMELDILTQIHVTSGYIVDMDMYNNDIYVLAWPVPEPAYHIVTYNADLDSVDSHTVTITDAVYLHYPAEIKINDNGEFFIAEYLEHMTDGADLGAYRKLDNSMNELWETRIESDIVFVWPTIGATLNNGGILVSAMQSDLMEITSQGYYGVIMPGVFGYAVEEESSYTFVNQSWCMAFHYSKDGGFLPWTMKVQIEHVEWYNPEKVLCLPDPHTGILLQLDAGMPDNVGTITWSDGTEGNSVIVTEPGAYYADFIFREESIGYTDTFIVEDHYFIGENPEFDLLYDGTLHICEGTSLDIEVDVTNDNGEDYTYELTPAGPEFDRVISLGEEGAYTIKVTDSHGCFSDSSFALTVKHPYADNICMVTTDDVTGKNIIVWDKSPGPGMESYTITRGLGRTEVGSVPFDGANNMTDQEVDPKIQAYRYFLTSTDTCGNGAESEISHKTLHLTASWGTAFEVNLIWEPYEGVTVYQYNIYRSRNSVDFELIGGVEYDPSINQYTDYDPPFGLVFYKIGIEGNFSCELEGLKKSVGAPVTEIFSNVKSMESTGIGQNSTGGHGFSIYPNPAVDRIHLVIPGWNKDDLQFRLVNQLGAVVFERAVTDSESEWALPEDIPGGLYYVMISGPGNAASVTGKIVIE